MVVFASLVCNIVVDGICFSFGMFFIELVEYFDESKGKTAFVGSLIPGLYLGMGMLLFLVFRVHFQINPLIWFSARR